MPRYDRLDALRGLAMVWMTAFHFCYDLNHFGYIRQNFLGDPFWTWQRSAIVGLFLFCAGFGQAVALAQGQSLPRFWRRWAQVTAAALLVSAGSVAMFPRTFIYFGVLHGIAVMLVLVRLAGGPGMRRPGRTALLGAVFVAVPLAAPAVLGTGAVADLFNSRGLNWLGFITRKPVTEDFVPLLPWLGVVCWGLAAGAWTLRHRAAWVQGPLPAAAAPLAWLGRWSLSYYLLHQPVLLGGLMAAGWLLRTGTA